MRSSKNKPDTTILEIDRLIHNFRGQRVMLDSDLASLYGVTTGNLNLAMKRNLKRFPEDFVFQLTVEESDVLILQIARSNKRGGRRHQPFAFTEQGVAMLSGVLNSDRAIEVNVAIMRAFVRTRGLLAASAELAEKLAELESKLSSHDYHIATIFESIRRLTQPPRKTKPKIGYL